MISVLTFFSGGKGKGLAQQRPKGKKIEGYLYGWVMVGGGGIRKRRPLGKGGGPEREKGPK